MQPRDAPRRLGIRSGEHLETARRVHGHELAVARAHRGVEGVACAQYLTAALARSMPRVDGVSPIGVGLDRSVFVVQETIADGKATDLVEANRLPRHDFTFDAACSVPTSRSRFSADGPERRVLAMRVRSRSTAAPSRSRKVSDFRSPRAD